MKNSFRTRRKSLYLWCIAWTLFLNPTFASPLQDRKVSGTVTSNTDGEGLIGVSVQVKERPNVGTITDLDGKYSIQAGSNETLIFSFIGYQTQRIKASKTILNVELKEDSKILDEVVVVGYGTMKRSDLTGAVTSISEDEIKQSVITSLDQALQGRAAGRCIRHPELGSSGRRYLRQHPRYQLTQRKRTALRYRRCSYIRKQQH